METGHRDAAAAQSGAVDAGVRGLQAIPQYRELNAGMSLDEFKTIFWWEWSHRCSGA